MRVYLAVDYDYSENRIGAMTAHATGSDNEIHTPFEQGPATQRFKPIELRQTAPAGNGQPAKYETQALASSSLDILHFQSQAWKGSRGQTLRAPR